MTAISTPLEVRKVVKRTSVIDLPIISRDVRSGTSLSGVIELLLLESSKKWSENSWATGYEILFRGAGGLYVLNEHIDQTGSEVLAFEKFEWYSSRLSSGGDFVVLDDDKRQGYYHNTAQKCMSEVYQILDELQTKNR